MFGTQLLLLGNKIYDNDLTFGIKILITHRK
jgi:hypothetical protein